jgi:hypothetical protein
VDPQPIPDIEPPPVVVGVELVIAADPEHPEWRRRLRPDQARPVAARSGLGGALSTRSCVTR